MSPITLADLIFAVAPSMFGRDLAEQIRTDAKGGDRQVPIIVEKCIDAVEALGMRFFIHVIFF